jgi:uncharacterized protein with HEPN domain
MNGYEVYLNDIIENIERAQRFIADVSYDEFTRDDKIHYAVVRCLEIIGEATKRLPQSLRQQHPEIPWKSMTGTMDVIVHAYASINLFKVWQTVKMTFR